MVSLQITVYDVLSYLASGMTEEEILSDFPDLTHEDIIASLRYAADLPPGDIDRRFEAVKFELDDVHTSIQRTYQSIYTAFGVMMPALVGIFVFAAKEAPPAAVKGPAAKSALDVSLLATVFILIFAFGSFWTQNMWMELLRYVRYKYVRLMPRLYALSGQTNVENFVQSSGRRTFVNWIPILLLNVASLVIQAGAYLQFIRPAEQFAMDAVVIAFIIASSISATAVFVEAHRVEEEILNIAPHLSHQERDAQPTSSA